MKILFLILFSFASVGGSIYDLNITDINGNTIHLSDFKGKSMLIVNSASGSKYAKQLQSLDQLQKKFTSNLVVIAFPSGDFNHEPGDNKAIKALVASQYKVSYILAAKQSVTGRNIHPLFKWLTEAAQNGVVENPVQGDFFKYLIDEQGAVKGIFSGEVDPMDSVMINAITN